MESQSPHYFSVFTDFTDAGEHRGREIAMRLEQMRGVFGTLMVKANVNLPVPLPIVAFGNGAELRQFVPPWNGKPTQVASLFQGGDDRGFIMLDLGVENPWAVVSLNTPANSGMELCKCKWIPGLKRDSPNTFQVLEWMENPIRGSSEITISELFPLAS